MAIAAAQPTRRRQRLSRHDYSSPGAYFITVCAYQRRCLFSRIEDAQVRLSPLGSIIDNEWQRTATLHDGVRLDAFVIMPNHIHAIVVLEAEAPTRPSLAVILNGFKSAVTRRARRAYGGESEIWQRGYYDHAVRNECDLESIREYIAANPARWAEDHENPERQ